MTLFPDSKLLIDGQLRTAAGGATYPNISPWTEEEIGRAADASLGDLDLAIGAARRAFDETTWGTDHEARLASLERFAQVMRASRDRFAAIARDEGGAAGANVFIQVDNPLAMLDGTLKIARDYQLDQDLGVAEMFGAKSRRMVWREPVGVVAAITPWNVPLQVNLAKCFPALCAGCTVVLKAAPDTPFSAALLGELAVEAGLPPGVFNVITGASQADLGEALVNDPRVDMITFTGSTAVGRRIMANASSRLARVFLELGGKSANIMLDDADFEILKGPSGTGALTHAGQGCANLTRLLVPRNRHDEAVAIMKDAFEAFPYGDPNAMQMMGPLISARQRERVLALIDVGKQEGATLVTGGGRPPQFERGYFVQPTLFANVDNKMRIAQEEFFGPVLVIIPFEDDDDAVRIANDSIYGLSGAVRSASMERALKVARRIRTGTLGVNGGVWFAGDSPFGGYKQSGIGREMGVQGFEEYLETKTVGVPA
jgi:aldehyde dehydrogenase (NAD+)